MRSIRAKDHTPSTKASCFGKRRYEKAQLRKRLLFHSLKKKLDSHMAAGKNLGSQKNGRAMPVPTTLFEKEGAVALTENNR